MAVMKDKHSPAAMQTIVDALKLTKCDVPQLTKIFADLRKRRELRAKLGITTLEAMIA